MMYSRTRCMPRSSIAPFESKIVGRMGNTPLNAAIGASWSTSWLPGFSKCVAIVAQIGADHQGLLPGAFGEKRDNPAMTPFESGLRSRLPWSNVALIDTLRHEGAYEKAGHAGLDGVADSRRSTGTGG